MRNVLRTLTGQGPRRHTRHLSKRFDGRTSVLASAALVSKESLRNNVRTSNPWQKQLWDYYDTVPELRLATSWKGNALSRSTLYVGKRDPDGSAPDPVEAGKLTRPLERLFGGPSGQAEMLRRISQLLGLPGESYILGEDETSDAPELWQVISNDELQLVGGDLLLRETDVSPPREINVDDVWFGKIWRPHPRRSWESDSPGRGVLAVLKELHDIGSHITATLESRLAGAGLLLVPNSITLTTPGEEGSDTSTDPFMAGLTTAMVTPLKNRDSASTVVPVVAKVADEAIDKIKHIRFDVPLDERIRDLREDAIKRLATGLDVPAEILLGMGDSNHWSAWQIAEEAIKLFVEPELGLICDALTTQYLRPAYEVMGITNPDDYVIWYDTAELAQRPNRGPEAMQLFDKGELSAEAMRRENGFSDEDAPTPQERRERLIVQLIHSKPELAPELINSLPSLAVPAQVSQGPTPLQIPSARPEIPQDTQDTDVVAEPPGFSAETWQLAAAELSVINALERVGKRLLSTVGRAYRNKVPRMQPWELHTYLDARNLNVDATLSGAYERVGMAFPARPCVMATVDAYVKQLITTRKKHTREGLRQALASAGCSA